MGRSTLIFDYKVPDLYEEVIKRTSKLGAFRSSDNSPHLAERLSMDGEDYLFYDMLDEARNEVYGWLAPFGRDVLNANLLIYDKDVISRTIERDYGTCANVGTDRFYFNVPSNLAIASDGVSYDEDTFTVTPASGITITTKRAVKIYYEVKYMLHTHFNGLTVEDIIDGEGHGYGGDISMAANDTSVLFGDNDFEFDIPEMDEDEVIDSVELIVTLTVEPASGTSTMALHQGEYVDHVDCDGSNKKLGVYLMTADKDETEWLRAAIKLPYDPRDLLRYTLYGPEGTDANLVTAAKRHIQEALVNFVIYRWLEYTLPDEAERYNKMFEKAIREAVREIDCNPMDIRKPVKFL